MSVKVGDQRVPVIAHDVPDSQETGGPHRGAGVRKRHERADRESRRACQDCRHVTHARDEIPAG